ncbi:MAG: YihY/virulence factor BrkB family protein [Candidatus Binatia bacterium]
MSRISSRPAAGAAALLVGVARRFYADQCLMRASALAYTSLLSIVPLMALMFAVLKGLGVQNRLEPVLLSRLSLTPDTTALIIDAIDRTNVGTLGALGATTLLFTVVSVLGTIEASFNFIWRVDRQRSLWRQVTDYVSVVMLTPFLLLAAVAITSAAQVQLVLQWVLTNGYLGGVALRALTLSPILINAVALGVLYAVMPNRRPAWRPTVASALVAGAAWHVVQVAYVNLQIGVARNDAIYGALAQLPVTLLWLYLSWTIVLAGAELAAVLELGAAADNQGRRVPRSEVVALHVLVRAADAFEQGTGGIDLPAVAAELRMDLGTAQRTADHLIARGWLARLEDTGRLVLTRAPGQIALAQLKELAPTPAITRRCDPRVRAALSALHHSRNVGWGEMSLADVLAPLSEAPDATP